MALRLISIDEIKKYLLDNNTNSILISNTILSSTEKLEFLCKCGENYQASWHKIKTQNKFTCNKCSKAKRIEANRMVEEKRISKLISLDGNILISKYINNREKITIMCRCGEYFETTYGSYINSKHEKKACNNCSQRDKKYEDFFKDILILNNIKFYREKQFNDLFRVRPLKFDFYLPEYNICVEIDEKHHNNMSVIKETDIMKDEYCIKNNITLLRINHKKVFEISQTIIDDIVCTYAKA